MSRSEDLSEEFHDRVDDVAGALLKWAGEHCKDNDGSLGSLLLGMAAARVTGSCLSLLPAEAAWAALRMVTSELHDTYREGRKVGSLN